MSRLVASFGGVGYAPVAPGTVGAAVAAVLGAGLMQGPAWALPLAICTVTAAGFVAIPRAVTEHREDPSWVVIDEVAGQWLAMLALGAATWQGVGLAFLLFRLFDINKVGPVGWADRQHGVLGIMVDDLVAGAMTAAVLLGVRYALPGLLG